PMPALSRGSRPLAPRPFRVFAHLLLERLASKKTGLVGFASFACLAAALAACGHPATEAECSTILERVVALELKAQKVPAPAEVAKRRGENLGLSGDSGKAELLRGCIGKHITNRALSCVREAQTASEITDHCLQ